jgi:hypothetical protein
MVASLENTITKWRAVNTALRRASGGKMRGTAELRKHNAPTYQQITTHLTRAFNAENNISKTPAFIRGYFTRHRDKRFHITAAYNKLNNLYRELATVRAKAVATSTIQRHWKTARPAVMNKRRATALLTLQALPGVPETRRMVFEMAFPRPVYGPNPRMLINTSRRKYRFF